MRPPRAVPGLVRQALYTLPSVDMVGVRGGVPFRFRYYVLWWLDFAKKQGFGLSTTNSYLDLNKKLGKEKGGKEE